MLPNLVATMLFHSAGLLQQSQSLSEKQVRPAGQGAPIGEASGLDYLNSFQRLDRTVVHIAQLEHQGRADGVDVHVKI